MPYDTAKLLEPGQGKTQDTNQDVATYRETKDSIFVGAFDGVSRPPQAPTEPLQYRSSELTRFGEWGRGRVAAKLLAEEIRRTQSCESTTIIQHANRKIHAAHAELGLDITDPLLRLAAAAAIAVIDKATGRVNWAAVADCRVAIVHADGRYECLNQPTTQDQEHIEYRTKCRRKGMTEAAIAADPGWQAMFAKSLTLTNQPPAAGGYGVVNGDPELVSNGHIQAGSATLETGEYFLVATDGVDVPLREGEKEADWWRDTFFKVAQNDGVQAGLEAVHETINKLVYKMDPTGTTRPRTHLGRDDAGGVAVYRVP